MQDNKTYSLPNVYAYVLPQLNPSIRKVSRFSQTRELFPVPPNLVRCFPSLPNSWVVSRLSQPRELFPVSPNLVSCFPSLPTSWVVSRLFQPRELFTVSPNLVSCFLSLLNSWVVSRPSQPRELFQNQKLKLIPTVYLIVFNNSILLIYRITHKGWDFSDDIKLPKSTEFEGVSVFTFCMTLVDVDK